MEKNTLKNSLAKKVSLYRTRIDFYPNKGIEFEIKKQMDEFIRREKEKNREI